MSLSYAVSIETAQPRAIAAVRARLSVKRVPAEFATYLDQVYAAARRGEIHVDGQNVFVYHSALSEEVADIAFGVGVAAPFAALGTVEYVKVPSGEVAHTTHRGAYARLGDAHGAVIAWCKAHGHELTGTRWEVYAHQAPGPEQPQTDVYYQISQTTRPL